MCGAPNLSYEDFVKRTLPFSFDKWYNNTLPAMPESKAELRHLLKEVWFIARENKQ